MDRWREGVVAISKVACHWVRARGRRSQHQHRGTPADADQHGIRIACVGQPLRASRGGQKTRFFKACRGGLCRPPLDEPPLRNIVLSGGARARTSPKIDEICLSGAFGKLFHRHFLVFFFVFFNFLSPNFDIFSFFSPSKGQNYLKILFFTQKIMTNTIDMSKNS